METGGVGKIEVGQVRHRRSAWRRRLYLGTGTAGIVGAVSVGARPGFEVVSQPEGSGAGMRA